MKIIRRLNYSLEVANAAGIKKPVYSNGQIMKDDPDFPRVFGSDGIATKLNIKKSIKDVSELSGELRNRQYVVNQLVVAKVGMLILCRFSINWAQRTGQKGWAK